MKRRMDWMRLTALIGIPITAASLNVMAGMNTTSLPNGAELSVSVTDPVTSTEFQVPHNQPNIDVDVEGEASVGEGDPNVTLVYVIDVSASTLASCDSGNILDCEKQAVLNLNTSPNISSVDEVGVVVYGEGGAPADMTPAGGDDPITAPDAGPGDVATVVNSIYTESDIPCDAGVGAFANKNVGCDGTDFSAGLAAATTVVNASSNGTNLVIFLSDGLSNQEEGLGFGGELAVLQASGAIVHAFAVGAGSSCAGGSYGALQDMADATGGSCTSVVDPSTLPDILPDLISTSLDEVTVNGGPTTTIPAVPQDGPITVDYNATVANLEPADHDICATATGHDNAGAGNVTQCETIHLLQLMASPLDEINELNSDNTHTVTAEIVGGSGPVRDISFVVGGQNAASAVPSNAALPTAPNSPVDFIYTVPQTCDSLGADSITVSAVIGGSEDSIVLAKQWIDTVPPTLSCDAAVNPHGNNKPTAPGGGGQGQNQDGFYQLNTEDPTLDCEVTLTVMDESGYVFPGPFNPGDVIKYTQDDDVPQVQQSMGSGQGAAGAVSWHLTGHGDLHVTATDTSGNQSSTVCLVPQPPK